MAVITATISHITVQPGHYRDDLTNNARRVLVTAQASSAAATSSDTGKIAGVAAAVTAAIRDGRTYTLRDGMVLGQGEDSSGGQIWPNSPAVSGNDLTYNLNTTPGASTAAGVNATAIPMQFAFVLDGTLP